MGGTRDAFLGSCSRCGRNIRLEPGGEGATLTFGSEGRIAERICDECREREGRQRAGFCRVCESEVENPEGLVGPVCTECYGQYLEVQDWPALEREMRARWNPEDPEHQTRVRLVNLRGHVEQHESQHLERFPMVVRPRRAQPGGPSAP